MRITDAAAEAEDQVVIRLKEFDATGGRCGHRLEVKSGGMDLGDEEDPKRRSWRGEGAEVGRYVDELAGYEFGGNSSGLCPRLRLCSISARMMCV